MNKPFSIKPIFIFILIIYTSILFGQHTISGTVTDKDEMIIGANVFLKVHMMVQ